jgi:hypothetical protein
MSEANADPRQSDIRDFLEELQRGPMISEQRAKIEACMRHFQKAGLTIATCADARHMGRSVATVKGYARQFGLRFPDYIPMALRTAEEMKRGPRKAKQP